MMLDDPCRHTASLPIRIAAGGETGMIQRLKKAKTVYLATQIVDMRKSINGLAAIVQGSFALDLYEGSAFVFISRSHDKIKVLQWDTDGFVLYYKRREKGKFQWPHAIDPASGTVHITTSDLVRLLDGLVMEQFIPHKDYSLY